MEDAYAYILEKLNAAGEYAFLPEGMLEEMLQKLLALDDAFMRDTGVQDGAEYDDDAALEALHQSMKEAYPQHAMYMLRLTEDYLDFNEDYLESIGAIEWE